MTQPLAACTCEQAKLFLLLCMLQTSIVALQDGAMVDVEKPNGQQY